MNKMAHWPMLTQDSLLNIDQCQIKTSSCVSGSTALSKHIISTTRCRQVLPLFKASHNKFGSMVINAGQAELIPIPINAEQPGLFIYPDYLPMADGLYFSCWHWSSFGQYWTTLIFILNEVLIGFRGHLSLSALRSTMQIWLVLIGIDGGGAGKNIRGSWPCLNGNYTQ